MNFHVILQSPTGCQLHPSLQNVPVHILDSSHFPSDKYARELDEGDSEVLAKASLGILIEFVKYTFNHVPTIWWKAILILFLDQLSNVYYFCQIVMRVYLVDVILALRDE